MNHKKIYDQIIQTAKSQNRIKLRKNQESYVYYENHHIIPRCLDGNDEKENLVLLTAREHFVCHKLLTYIYFGNRKTALAFHRMTFSKKYGKIVSSRDYAYATELFRSIPVSIETRKKRSKSLTGRIFTDEHCDNISKSLKGKPNNMKGKKHKKEFGQNVSKSKINNGSSKGEKNSMFGKSVFDVWVLNYGIEEANTRLESCKNKMSNTRTGKKFPKQHCANISKGRMGQIYEKIECPYCKKTVDPGNFKRWHGDHCKNKYIK